MPEILVPEWREDIADTLYPFSPSVTLVNQAGYFIPNGTFEDAMFYAVGGSSGLYISSIVIAGSLATIFVSDDANSDLASGQFNLLSPGLVIAFQDQQNRPAGVLVVAPLRLAVLQAWGQGTQVFTKDETEFVAAVYQPSPEVCFRGFQLADGTIVTGDIWLVGDDGVVVRYRETQTPDGVNHPTVRIDVVGDPLFARRLCTPLSLFTTPRFIKTIRVVSPSGTFLTAPDAHGNFNIGVGNNVVDDVALRVRSSDAGLIFEIMGTANGN